MDLHPIRQRNVFSLATVKVIKTPTYTIKDALGEPFQGTCDEQEMQSSLQEIYRASILKKRKNEVLVKWKGNRNVFNSCVPLTDLEQLPK